MLGVEMTDILDISNSLTVKTECFDITESRLVLFDVKTLVIILFVIVWL